jgi:hypothetical protein
MWAWISRVRGWAAAAVSWLRTQGPLLSPWVTQHKEIITLAAALLGGVFAGWQYLESKKDNRKRETIRYVERSLAFEDPVAQAYVEMTKAILSEAGKCQLKHAAEAYRDRKEVAPMQEFLHARQLEAHVLVLTKFYQSLHVCVKGDICDQRSACEHFAGDIKDLRENYLAFFMDYRDRWGRDLMKEPYEFARSCAERKPSLAVRRDCPPIAAAPAASGGSSAHGARVTAGRAASAASGP